MRKIFFFDIDGTLATGNNIPIENLAALKKLKDDGHLTFICSGRAPFYAMSLFGDLVSGYICCNGRYIIYEGKRLHGEVLTKEEFAWYERKFQELDCPYFFISDDHIYYHNVSIKSMEYMKKAYGEQRLISNPGDLPYYIFNIYYRDDDHKNKIFTELADKVVFNDHKGGSADCTTIDYDKGHGISYLLDYFKISKEDAYAFGDGSNDVAMFREVANKVAMGNAVEELKKEASFVSGNHDEGGIINALAYYGLIKAVM